MKEIADSDEKKYQSKKMLEGEQVTPEPQDNVLLETYYLVPLKIKN